MLFKSLVSLALAASASAQNITDVLAANSGTLGTLTNILGSQPAIVKALSSAKNITILAPSNDAFTAFLKTTAGANAAKQQDVVSALLTYHVLTGKFPGSSFTSASQFIPTLLTNASYTNVTGGQRVAAHTDGGKVVFTSGLLAKSNVVVADVAFDGGVIHVIDSVLTIPASDSDTATAAGLTSLATALTTANLVPTVNGLKDVTIFAPSNDAFTAIASAAAGLTTQQLTSVLTYHVVAGTVGYSSLLSNTTLKTVNGANVTITVSPAGVMVNKAKVTIADVLVANGVVHVIDSVLMPAASNSTTTTSPTGGASPTSTPAQTTGAASQMVPGGIVGGLSVFFAAALAL